MRGLNYTAISSRSPFSRCTFGRASQVSVDGRSSPTTAVGFIVGVDFLSSRKGRAQPRIVVPRFPPGISRRDLSGINPIERIVGAMRRALPVVGARPSKSSRATVLMQVTLAGKSRSSARLQGFAPRSASSACARRSFSTKDSWNSTRQLPLMTRSSVVFRRLIRRRFFYQRSD